MKLLVLIVLLAMFWTASFFFFNRRRDNEDSRTERYVSWLLENLDAMFYRAKAQNLRRIILILALVGAVIGFILPGKFSKIDQMTKIERAIDFNKIGEYDKALLELDRLKGLNSPIVQNELGIAHLGRQDYNSAEKAFIKAVRLLPQYSKAHYNLAGVYSQMGRDIDAAFEMSRAKEAGKYTLSPEALYNLGGDIFDNLAIRVLLAVVLGFLGYQLPRLAVKYLKFRRIRKFEEQLPDGLVMAANGLRAGYSLLQALDLVAKESRAPLSQEFELVLREHRLGLDLDQALRHLSQRMPTTDTRIFANSIIILRETGGNLTEIFDTLSSTIQERQRVTKKIKTMTAEGETQAYMLALLPIILGFVLDYLNNDVFRLLYTTFLGWIILIIIVLMEGIGLYWMLKMVKVKI